LPKRDEFLFRRVLALPNASSKGLLLSTCCETPPPSRAPPASSLRPVTASVLAAAQVMYCMTCLVASVLPAPDSPEMRTDWLRRECSRPRYACSATAKICGGSSPSGLRAVLTSAAQN
jgi:hypothetical protein